MKRLVLLAAVVAALAVGAGQARASASHGPNLFACARLTPPSGALTPYVPLPVAPLTQLGYKVPAQVDSAGNGNGWVCAAVLPKSECDALFGGRGTCPVPVFFEFEDD